MYHVEVAGWPDEYMNRHAKLKNWKNNENLSLNLCHKRSLRSAYNQVLSSESLDSEINTVSGLINTAGLVLYMDVYELN